MISKIPSFLFSNGNFEELSDIVKKGDLESLRKALSAPDIQLVGVDGTTVLHVAAATNNPELVRELLRHQRLLPLLDRQDWAGFTPVMAAVLSDSPLTVDVLCRCGADLTKTVLKSGETALHLACHLRSSSIAQILLKYDTSSAFINQMDFSGDTALCHAVQYDSPAFDTLLDAGASIDVQNPDNRRTLLHLAVAYNQTSMLLKIMGHPIANIKEFADRKDIKGETALMIAVKLDQFDIIDILTNSVPNLTGVNVVQSESVLHVAILHNRFDILRHLLYNSSSDSVEFCDNDFRTPLMYAAQLNRQKCLQELIEYGANDRVKNFKTGETLLHIIAKYHSNICLPVVMALNHVSWFFMQKDYNGNTPYMTAIISGNDIFLHEAFKVKNVDLTEFNFEGETATFYAIKQGNLKVLITLLLSPKYYEFTRRTQSKLNFEDPIFIRQAEICGEIYASDVYILTGHVVDNVLVSYFPPNLLVKTKSGQNVFHACALGGSLDCLRLLFSFYQLFAPISARCDYDSPEESGITPLLYAAKCAGSHESCVYFFATHGSNLGATDMSGFSVVEAILLNNPDSAQLFLRLLNQCVHYKKEHYASETPNISVDYTMLCPKHENQMRVVATLFKHVKGNDRQTILQHPVIVTFLRKKASTINSIFYFKFISSIVVAIIISIIIPILYVDKQTPTEKFGKTTGTLISLIFLFVILLCILNNVTKLPMVVNREMWFSDYVTFITTISILSLAICGKSFPFTEELSATVILSSWMSVLAFAVNTYSTFNYQVAVYIRLIFGISKRIILLTLIIFAFSVSLSCLYHKDTRLKNALACFIYAFTVLLPGYLAGLPTFNSSYFQNTPDKIHFCTECFVLGSFVIITMLGFTNMLVGLAVRSGQALEIDGQIFQDSHVTHYITELEYWFTNKIYRWIVKWKMFNCIAKIEHKLFIKKILHVYEKENKKICDISTIQKFRKIISYRYMKN